MGLETMYAEELIKLRDTILVASELITKMMKMRSELVSMAKDLSVPPRLRGTATVLSGMITDVINEQFAPISSLKGETVVAKIRALADLTGIKFGD